MKPLLFIFSIALLLSSCAQVYFSDPQPKKGMTIKSFMADLQGEYADSVLQITIDKKELVVGDEHYRLTNKFPGEGEVLVKFYKNFYFANFSDSVYYSVIMGKFYDDKLAIYMLSPDGRTIERLKNFGKITFLDSVNKTYLMNSSKKQFDQLVDYEMFEVTNVLEKK